MPIRRSPSAPAGRTSGLPEATVARLPVYLRSLECLRDRGIAQVSSDDLAAACGSTSAVLRKDLSLAGVHGTRGVGYAVHDLLDSLSHVIGLRRTWPVVIVGVGNLGHALAAYRGFAERGFTVVGLLDTDQTRIGEHLDCAGEMRRIEPLEHLEAIIAVHDVHIGVIATPAAQADRVCARLVAAGVTSILNFAPTVLTVPPGVEVRDVDLSLELHMLAYHELAISDLRQSGLNAAHTIGERVS